MNPPPGENGGPDDYRIWFFTADKNKRLISPWIQDQLCSSRLQDYRRELRTPPFNLDIGPEDRPYGLPWNVQGAVEDVWFLICECIWDPKSIMRLYDTAPIFRHFLRRKYIQIQLPRIVDICLESGGIYASELLPDPADLAIPRKTQLRLNLRLVSRLTKSSVETTLRDKEIPVEGALVNRDILMIVLSRVEDIHDFRMELDLFNLQNDGIFYPTTLQISGYSQVPNLTVEVPLILQRIGRSIRTLHYEAFLCDPYETTYNEVSSWVTLTPNLEALTIYPRYFLPEPAKSPDVIIPVFPTLRKLNFFSDTIHFPVEFTRSILQANPTVKIVKQDRRRILNLPAMYLSPPILPVPCGAEAYELEEFTCVRLPPSQFFLTVNHWPLRKLSLRDLYDDLRATIVEMDSHDLFRFLGHFRNTLEDLQIELPIRDTGGDLDLPRVRKFEWRVPRQFKSLDFMLPMIRLENFKCTLGDGLKYNSSGRFYISELDIQKPRDEVLGFYRGLRNKNFRETKFKAFFRRLKIIQINRVGEAEETYHL